MDRRDNLQETLVFTIFSPKLFHHPILAFNDLLARVWRWLHRWILPTTAMDQSLGTVVHLQIAGKWTFVPPIWYIGVRAYTTSYIYTYIY